MKRAVLATAALVAAVAVLTLLIIPPAPLELDVSWTDGTVPGLLHIHSNRSDGLGTPDEIADAAARAGLKFIVVTDHGDGTRAPDPPAYRSGVLCLDGAEISTNGGHYIALEMGASAYPLAGEPRDVVEDVRRLGGFGIAAHPDSPKSELRWSDWQAPIDALEMVNPDTGWRVHLVNVGLMPKLTLLRALLTYPIRSTETIGALLTDSPALEAQWDALTPGRRIVGLAGADAHARLELRGASADSDSYSLPIPGYESSFSALSVHVSPAKPFTGDAIADAQSLVAGIRNGRVYTAVDAWASPPAFEFTAENRHGRVSAGDELPVGGPLSLRVRSNAPPSFLTTVRRGSELLAADRTEHDLTLTDDERPGVYRVEIRSPDRPGRPPWLISNPIYVRGTDRAAPAPPRRPATARLSLFDGYSTAGWTMEADPTSLVALEAVLMSAGTELRVRYGLSGGAVIGQYSGVAVGTPRGIADYDRATFTIRADRLMRISVQIRADDNYPEPERWQRSILVNTTDSQQTVSFDDMQAIGTTHTPQVAAEDVRALMFIVDTTNSRPGASGRLWIRNVQLERSRD